MGDEDDLSFVPEFVQTEIEALYDDFPGLRERYNVICRIGDGTFSAVYKATSLRDPAKTYALKRIYLNSSPQRVESEVVFLRDLGGRHNVVGLVEGIRVRDQIILVLEYFEHTDFKQIIQDPSVELIRSYMSELFEALAYIHSQGVVHRDVKPANFLFNMNTGTAMLVDFGLAQYLSSHGGRPSSRKPRNLPSSDPQPIPRLPSIAHLAKLRPTTMYNPNDTRSRMRAHRAGTRGFRAPEVLLKQPVQTGALDVWSAGVILLSMITGRYPFFVGKDDNFGLYELELLLGHGLMQEAAASCDRRISVSDLPTLPHIRPNHSVDWRMLCERLRPSIAGRYPDSLYKLLDRCLDPVAPRRLRAIDAFNEPFLMASDASPLPTRITPPVLPATPLSSPLHKSGSSSEKHSQQAEREAKAATACM